MNKRLKKCLFRVGVLTAAMHGINQFLFYCASKKQILYRYEGKYFKTKMGSMFYHVYGNKESDHALLLLHDLTCASSGYEWNKVVPKLSENYKIYVLDLLGCGRSDKPEIAYTSYLYIQLIKSFINEVIGMPVNIVATGKTASIATQLKAMDHDSLLKKVIAINPELNQNMPYEKAGKKFWIKNIYDLPILGTFLYNLYMSKNLIEEQFEENYFCDQNRIRNKYIDAYYESAHLSGSSSRFLFSSLQAHYLDLDIENALKKMDDNYLLILGKCYIHSHNVLDKCKLLNESIKIITCNKTSYLPQLENPEMISQITIDFTKE